MDNQDHTRTRTPGHGNHGVHLCHKCGWPFPNPHPSAKHRRAHKKICGTIEGYKLFDSEGPTHLNASDDEHLSDDDHKTPGQKILETGGNDKGNGGVGEKVNRSEDEVFSDAVADFPESGLSSRVEEPLQNILVSVTNVEGVDRKDPTISTCFKEKIFNDISQLTVKPSVDFRMQNPGILQSEQDVVGNTLGIQGQPPFSTVDPLWNSVSDSRTEDSTVGQRDDGFGLQSDSHPSKAEAMSDALEENKVYAGKMVTDYSVTFVASSNDFVSEASDTVPKVEDSDVVTSDHEVADGAPKLKEGDSIMFFPEVSQYDLPLEVDSAVNTIVTTSDSEVKSAPVLGDGTSNDLVKTMQEKGERNFDVDTHFMADDKPDVAHVESEFEDFKDHDKVVLQNPIILQSSQALKHEEGDFKETTTEENYSDFNSSRLREESEVLSPDVHVLNDTITIKQEQDNCEPVAEEMLAEERSEVSSVKLKDDGFKRSYDVGSSVDVIKPETESHINHFSGVQDSDNSKKSQQLNLPEDSVIGPSHEYEDFKCQERVALQDPLSLLSYEALKHEENDLKDTKSGENHFSFDATQLLVESKILSPDMHGLDNTIKQEQGDCEPVAEKQSEVFPVQLTVDNKQRSDEIGESVDVTKPDVYGSCAVNIPGEQESDDVHKNSKQGNVSEGCVAVPTDESPRDAPIDSATSQTTSVNSMDATSKSEKNTTEIDVDVNGMLGGTNVESDVAIRTLKPSNLLQFEVKSSSDVFKDDGADERGKSGKCDMTDAQCGEGLIVTGNSLPKSGSSDFESPVVSEDVMDGSARKPTAVECTNIYALSDKKEDVKYDINNGGKLQEEHVSTVSDLQQSRDAELLVKAPEDQTKEDPSLSPLSTEHSVQNVSDLDDNQVRGPAGETLGSCSSPVQDQSGNNLVKQLGSSRIDASVYSGSRCDSLEGNWGSVSVLSAQSDAPAVTDVETLASTDMPASTESTRSNLNNPEASSEGQQYEKSEMFEPPSFMTLVESGHAVGPKVAASEVQGGQNPQHPSSTTSQAGWFPTLTQVVNESQGRKKNEEIIAKVTNWSTSKQHMPLKSLLGEAAQSNKPKSPRQEENQVHQKNEKVLKDNGSGLTTVNSILGPESPAAQAAKIEAGKEWNSPARYPADIKREKRKVKSRPYWMQFVCCSTVDPQHS